MDLLPLFVNVRDRRVLLVGGGAVASAKLEQLLAVGADVMVVAPEVVEAIDLAGVRIERRRFVPADLDGVWLVVAAATGDVNAEVAAAANARQIIVNAVDDPPNATAYFAGVIRRNGLTVALSTAGAAPGLTALLREAIDALLPDDLDAWMAAATRERADWRKRRVPIRARRPLLLEALNRLYAREKTA